MAVNAGMARPVARPKRAEGSEKKQKEDGILTSQKALLTWMIDDDRLFDQISQYISPGVFTESLYRTVAELLYEQRKQGALNPAKILNHFTEEEDHEKQPLCLHKKSRAEDKGRERTGFTGDDPAGEEL